MGSPMLGGCLARRTPAVCRSAKAVAPQQQWRSVVSQVRELPNLRQQVVMRRQQFWRRVSLGLGHTGYIVGLLEYGVTDIILLRLYAMTGASLIVLSQLVQPKIQWVTAFWNFAYSSVNLYQLLVLREGPEPQLSWEEASLQERFQHRIDVRGFHAMAEQGQWLWLVDGAALQEPGPAGWRFRDQLLYFITVGECNMSVGEHVVAVLGPGSIVGETGVLSEDAGGGSTAFGADVTVTASGSVRCFAVPVEKVRQLQELQPSLRGALQGIFADSLADKLRQQLNAGIKERNYRAVLEVFCTADGQAPLAPDMLESYRQRHGVDEAMHIALVELVPQCSHRPSLVQIRRS